jgi:hypothetical protein
MVVRPFLHKVLLGQTQPFQQSLLLVEVVAAAEVLLQTKTA